MSGTHGHAVSESPTRALARFAAETSAGTIPAEVRHEAKRLFLDGLGCALGGYTLDAGRIAITGLSRWRISGRNGATVVGDGNCMPASYAAYLNAKLGSLMDMDEVLLNIAHLSPVVHWSALALAEEEQCSGEELLTAYTLGFEVGARVFLALGTIFELRDGHIAPAKTTGFGQAVIGGAAACGRILNLPASRMVHALALGAMQTPAPLSHKSITDMSMAKGQMDGAAAGAVLGAVLAAVGHTGPATILDDDSYAHAMARRSCNPKHLLDGLGDRWHLGLTSIKPYPHCRHTHYALDLVCRLVREHGLRPQEIERITVRGFASFGVPPWNNIAPRNVLELEFSLPYGVALAAAGVPPGPEWLRQERLRDPLIADLARRVAVEANPEIQERIIAVWPDPLTEVPTTVTISARGSSFTASDRFALGDGFAPTHRLDDNAVIAKFRCNAEAVLPAPAISRLVDAVFNLEKVKSLSVIARDLTVAAMEEA
jgi:2-methylcitrate dehydratase PrpD